MQRNNAEKKDMASGIFIMAAGFSNRFKALTGGQHKLLAKGKYAPYSILELTYHSVLQAFPQSHIFIITNENEPEVIRLSRQLTQNTFIIHSDGLSTSIASAISLLQRLPIFKDIHQLFILPADLPFIQRETFTQLQELFSQSKNKIIRPIFKDFIGHPVGFHHSLFPELRKLSGDFGAKALLKTYPVTVIPSLDPGIIWDIDTPMDLEIHPDLPEWDNLSTELLQAKK